MKLTLLYVVLTLRWMSSMGHCGFTGYQTSFYWLDYLGGPMPNDVLKVDAYSTTQFNYVGQLYTKEWELLPATVRTSLPFATSHANQTVFTENTQIKVLASRCKGNFQWIPTDVDGYNSVAYLVPAGSEIGKQLYFAKFEADDGSLVLGKVNSGYEGATAPYMDTILVANTSFSVLTYQPPSKFGCFLNETNLKYPYFAAQAENIYATKTP